LAIVWALLPLLKQEKSAPAARASYDKQVFKDQLAEIEADEARGLISKAEAQRVRTEVSRRLLTAAKEEEAEKPTPNAPKAATYTVAALIVLSATIGGLNIYTKWGTPGLPDLPIDENRTRQAARSAPPTQAQLEAMITARNAQAESTGLPNLDALTQSRDAELLAQLAEALKSRPDDLEGHRLLASNLANAGRFIEAHAAQEVVMRILGDQASPEDYLDNAALMINAAEGFVSAEALAALDVAMKATPENPRARFYAGLALWQYERPRQAFVMWRQLLQEGPEDAPWIPTIRANMDALGADAAAAQQQPALAGPTAGQVAAAGDMTAEERQTMIRSMVAQLTERLASDGGSVEEWVRLIGANTVLGEAEAAAKAVADARAAFADDQAALARINEAAGQAAPIAAPALPGPSQEQVQDAASMSDGDRQQMIGSMVARLTERLATQGGSLEEWLRLINVNGVLGNKEAAAKAVADARAAFADSPDALNRIDAAAAALP
jgi:cytochrome c-type biogenesis protein CcmH